jgi:hypothetical protein
LPVLIGVEVGEGLGVEDRSSGGELGGRIETAVPGVSGGKEDERADLFRMARRIASGAEELQLLVAPEIAWSFMAAGRVERP